MRILNKINSIQKKTILETIIQTHIKLLPETFLN